MSVQLTEGKETILHAIDGMTGDHYSLARYCESKGLHVEGDTDDMELSHICVKDPNTVDDFWAVVVGEIRGDAEAKIARTTRPGTS